MFVTFAAKVLYFKKFRQKVKKLFTRKWRENEKIESFVFSPIPNFLSIFSFSPHFLAKLLPHFAVSFNVTVSL